MNVFKDEFVKYCSAMYALTDNYFEIEKFIYCRFTLEGLYFVHY